jgi:hypothetical protein
MSKTKEAVLKFSENGSDGLQDCLKILIGRIFKYDDQDGSHTVKLLSIGSSGLATLIDRNKHTGEPLKSAKEYTVSLYDDGVLTYL